ncbi:MAG: 6-pyruvoyl-tetrahydropterin synthase-related protein [Pseudomonadota bacterium]
MDSSWPPVLAGSSRTSSALWRRTAAILPRVCLWTLVYAVLLSVLHPELAILDGIPTGGDTGGHYAALAYWVEHILPNWRLTGWHPGNYAGFPLFEMYFPLPFALMALFGTVLPLTVAFKIVALAGALTLPPAVFYFLRNLGCRAPIPDLGAAFSLLFLFNEANPAWGGTLASTLAGEFTYALGLSLSLVYLGGMHRDIASGRGAPAKAVILALVGLAHGYTLLFCVAGVGFFLFSRSDWRRRLGYILEVNLSAFCLMGFWIVPLLLFSPYTTPFNFVWIINGWSEAVPRIAIPVLVLGMFGLAGGFRDPAERGRTFFVLFLLALALVYYLIAFKIGVVDVRFLPFAQLMTVFLAAAAAGRVIAGWKARDLAALGLAMMAAAWAADNETVIAKWAEWNFSGVEKKELWPEFKSVNDFLAGDFESPRVVYENGPITEKAGSIRAFESLPLFSGRAVLEGLYIQAGLAAPFVFYIQAEVSPQPSSPLRQYNYGRFDLDRAKPRLKLFNVGQFITVSEETRAAALAEPGFNLEMTAGPFSVFRVDGNSGRYVVEPQFLPILVLSDDPRRDAFLWFRKGDLDVPPVFGSKREPYETGQFAAVLTSEVFARNVGRLPRVPSPASAGLREVIDNERIVVTGAVPGRPLWIKVGYNPGWTAAAGASAVWRAAPCFMLVFPESDTVIIEFRKTWPDYLGMVLTLAGLVFVGPRLKGLIPGGAARLGAKFNSLAAWSRPRAGALLILGGALLTGAVLFLVLAVSFKDPVVYFKRGEKLYQAGEYSQAAAVFREAERLFPLSPVIDDTINRLALCELNQGNPARAREVWKRLGDDYPESRLLPEALFQMGACSHKLGRGEEAEAVWAGLRASFPDSPWADLTVSGAGPPAASESPVLFRRAMDQYDRGAFPEARDMFLALRQREGQGPLAEQCSFFAALCRFKSGDWTGALEDMAFFQLEHPRSVFIPEILFHVGAARQGLGDLDGAREAWERTARDYPENRWGGLARDLLSDLARED